MVKDYQNTREYLILSMVKKYPLYSLNKLSGELPGISRHSIQRILEKNNLSTIEKRLNFVNSPKDRGERPVLFFEKLRTFTPFLFRQERFNLDNLKGLIKKLGEGPHLSWKLAKIPTILMATFFIFWVTRNFFLTKPPEIILDQPSVGAVKEGERLFVSGKVFPKESKVTVNGNEVALNGDGSFTAVVNIPSGESILKIEASKRRKKSQILRLVSRAPTEKEIRAKGEEETRNKREAADKVAALERTVNDLLAAKNANTSILRILDNHVKEEAGFFTVVGEVLNMGKEDVSWVMVTAKFSNQGGSLVETKYGFATDFGQVIKPGEKANFETQATTKEFDHYSLELSWEKGEVVGVATKAAEQKKETTVLGEP